MCQLNLPTGVEFLGLKRALTKLFRSFLAPASVVRGEITLEVAPQLKLKMAWVASERI